MSENKAKQYTQQAIIQNVLNDMPQIIESAKLTAKIMRINYDAYVDAGFSKSEALELCKTHK